MIEVVFGQGLKPGDGSKYEHNAVNVACSMFDRHLSLPHRVTCVTDDPKGIDGSIRIIDIRSLPSYRYMNVQNPSSPVNPSCYVRLAIFAEEARDIFGEKIVSCD